MKPMVRMARVMVTSTALAFLAGIGHADPTAQFVPLGDLPGGEFRSYASAVSADGSVVVGQSESVTGREAFRWNATNGLVGLGLLGKPGWSTAAGASADGSIVIGTAATSQGDPQLFVWDAANGIRPLFAAGSTGFFVAKDVSGDGSLVIGDGLPPEQAFVWDSTNGLRFLGSLSGERGISGAGAVSSDGSIVVGGSLSASGHEAFRWDADTGMSALGDLLGRTFAYGVSADGSVVVGTSFGSSESEAFVWTPERGMVGLGDVSGGPFVSGAWDVSADGSVIVGYGTSSSGEVAVLWDESGAMQRVEDLLAEHGVDLRGWRLERASGISSDGRTVVGYGMNPSGFDEAWLARLPAPEVHVDIDVKPGSEANPINLRSEGLLPVAILGSASFDVAEIDVSTIAFGPGGVAPAHRKGGHFEDTNGDGVVDLVSHYPTQGAGIAVGDTEACVTGETVDGAFLRGCDAIAVMPLCGLGFELLFVVPAIVWLRRGSRVQVRRLFPR